MEKQNSSKHTIKFLFDLWKISPVLTWSMVIISALTVTLITTVAPLFISELLNRISSGNVTLDNSLGLLLGYALIEFMAGVVGYRVIIAMAYHTESKMQATIAAHTLDHLTQKSLSYHANRMSGGIVSDSNKLNGSIERFWDMIIFNATKIVATVVPVCIALSFIIWQFALGLAILSVITVVIIIKAQTSIAPISEKNSKKWSAMTAYFADVIGNIPAVKAFAGEKAELINYQKKIDIWRKYLFKEMKAVLLVSGTFGTIMTVMKVFAFLAAIIAIENHFASVGVIYLMIVYTMQVVSELWQVSNATRTYIRVIGDASPMIETLSEPIEITDPTKPSRFKISRGKIEFKDVVFTHEENNEALFDSFSLTIKPGEQIGLVGRSGSGKTSLARLLLRFSDIEKGQILIDGQDISKITQKDLRRAIAFVAQEPVLFHRSLRENIAYSKPGATDEEIRQAAEQASALEFVNKLPGGFDTIVGERGVKLSGGQRQRVVIARAILKNAPILVLDEATSALDSESEKLIQVALTKLMKGRTSVVIAHRLSTIAKLDRIVVLDDGKIIEQGTHNELLAKSGMYAKLWQHQSGGFIE